MFINSNVYVKLHDPEPDEVLKCLTKAITDYIAESPSYKDRKKKLNAYYSVFAELEKAARLQSIDSKSKKSSKNAHEH